MKYLFLTKGGAYFPNLTKNYHGAGCFNWYKCMEGDVRLWSELSRNPVELLDYDLIHINLAADDIGLAAEISKYLKESSTKLVVNMDYSINYMDKSVHIHELIADIQACDFAFGVEPAQTNLTHYIANMTTHTKQIKIMLLPHPVDLEYLNKKWIDYEHRQDSLIFHYHKYDGHLDIPWLLCYGLDVKHKIVTGYTNTTWDVKEMPEWEFWPFAPWEVYVDGLSRCKYGFEYRTHKAASRFIMEAAAVGVPVVSTHDSFMGAMLFPSLHNPIEDFKAMRNSLELLTTKDDFRLSVAKEGLERIEKYDFKHSKENMERLVE